MPGMGEEIDGAMQHAAQPGRQSIVVRLRSARTVARWRPRYAERRGRRAGWAWRSGRVGMAAIVAPALQQRDNARFDQAMNTDAG